MHTKIIFYAVSGNASLLEGIKNLLKMESEIRLSGCYYSFDSALKHFLSNRKSSLQNKGVIFIDDLSSNKIQTVNFLKNYNSGFKRDGIKTIVYTDSLDAGYLNELLIFNVNCILHDRTTNLKNFFTREIINTQAREQAGKVLIEAVKMAKNGIFFYDGVVRNVLSRRDKWALDNTVAKAILERYSFGQGKALPYEPNTNKKIKELVLKEKKIKALFVSAEPVIITGIISLFSDDALISLDTKKYFNINEEQKKESVNYDVIIYDDSNISAGQIPVLNIPPLNKNGGFQSFNKISKPQKIIYTDRLEPGHIKKLINTGAEGIVSKFSEEVKLKDAVIKVAGGEKYYRERTLDILYAGTKYDTILTQREKEILNYLQEGLSYKEIAQHINRANSTVNKHIENIKDKLGVKGIKELREMLM